MKKLTYKYNKPHVAMKEDKPNTVFVVFSATLFGVSIYVLLTQF